MGSCVNTYEKKRGRRVRRKEGRREGGREGGREGRKEGGREGGKEGGRGTVAMLLLTTSVFLSSSTIDARRKRPLGSEKET
jgi:hypothetical protein